MVGGMFLRTLRVLWFVAGAIWFVWLGIEDRNLTMLSILAAVLAALVGFTIWGRLAKGNNDQGKSSFGRVVFIGMISGATTSPLAAFLMVFKVGLHSHPSPDFTTSQIQAVLGRLPVWAVIGALLGLALGILFMSNGKQNQDD
jgi:hypothetical protein